MVDERRTLLGLYVNDHQAAAAIEKLRGGNFTVEWVHSPIPSHALMDALDLPKSKVGWFTLAGAICGFFCGFLLAAFASLRWGLIVGGKPVLAWIPFVIVGFEFTILFAVFGNVIGLISQARLPRRMPRVIDDASANGERFGVAASCAGADEDRLIRLLEDSGAQVLTDDAGEGRVP